MATKKEISYQSKLIKALYEMGELTGKEIMQELGLTKQQLNHRLRGVGVEPDRRVDETAFDVPYIVKMYLTPKQVGVCYNNIKL